MAGKHEAIARIYLQGEPYSVKLAGLFHTEEEAKAMMTQALEERGWKQTEQEQQPWLAFDWRSYPPSAPSQAVPEMNGNQGRTWTRHVCSIFNVQPLTRESSLLRNDAFGATVCAMDRLFLPGQSDRTPVSPAPYLQTRVV